MAQRSLVAFKEKDSVSDCDEDTQPEFGGVAIVNKPQKYLSPRLINDHPRMAGMKRHNFECIQRIKESKASADHNESLDEVDAHSAIDGSCTNELFGTPKIRQPGESGDAMDTQGDALETLSTEDLDQDPEPEVSVSDKDGGKCVAPESNEEVVNETLY